ncbi:unnamed protein product [Closterium sp. NIES-54]
MRPNIVFACNKLVSGLTVRSDQHWLEFNRRVAYLANTCDTALEFGGGPESLELVRYVDADNAGDKQKRTSTGGYVLIYTGGAVSWSSQRIKWATLSLTESEFVAATEAGKEGRCLRFLLSEFWKLDARKPTVLRVDNKSAITLTNGMGLIGNLKHMERRQAWLQHMVKHGKFSLHGPLHGGQPPPLPRPTTSPPQQQPWEGRGKVEAGAGVAYGGHPFHTTSPPTAGVAEEKATGKRREAAQGGTIVAVAECAAAAAA